jgi:hypothetical protein
MFESVPLRGESGAKPISCCRLPPTEGKFPTGAMAAFCSDGARWRGGMSTASAIWRSCCRPCGSASGIRNCYRYPTRRMRPGYGASNATLTIRKRPRCATSTCALSQCAAIGGDLRPRARIGRGNRHLGGIASIADRQVSIEQPTLRAEPLLSDGERVAFVDVAALYDSTANPRSVETSHPGLSGNATNRQDSNQTRTRQGEALDRK